MTDPTPATVAVPVELLKRYKLENEQRVLTGTEKELIGFLPKPTPRLVAVDIAGFNDEGVFGVRYLKTQPDLLTLLDEAQRQEMNSGNSANAAYVAGVGAVVDRIHAALGVTE